MRPPSFSISALCLAAAITGCKGGKHEIPLSSGQTYLVQPSGKMKVFSGAGAEAAQGSLPLHRLRVKLENQGTSAKTEGCWACTDCICNGDECSCTECTSC